MLVPISYGMTLIAYMVDFLILTWILLAPNVEWYSGSYDLLVQNSRNQTCKIFYCGTKPKAGI